MFKNTSTSFSDSFPADFSFKWEDMSLAGAQRDLQEVCRMLNKLQEQQIISVHKGTSTEPTRPAEGPLWTSAPRSPYPEAHTMDAMNKLLFSPNYRLASHENNSTKSIWGSLHRNPVGGSKNSLQFQLLHIFPSVPLSLHVLLRSN